jgi:hypothetical protein
LESFDLPAHLLTRFTGRQAVEVDPDGAPLPRSLHAIVQRSQSVEPAEAGQKEIFTSWALFILIMLLITALFTSYLLQQKKIQAVHETVISIFAGMDL